MLLVFKFDCNAPTMLLPPTTPTLLQKATHPCLFILIVFTFSLEVACSTLNIVPPIEGCPANTFWISAHNIMRSCTPEWRQQREADNAAHTFCNGEEVMAQCHTCKGKQQCNVTCSPSCQHAT